MTQTAERLPRPAGPPATDFSLAALPALRRSCLSYSEVLAQSVSVIAPSTVPAALMGLIFGRAGNATWLSFVLGVIGLTLVSVNINQFARRSASPGSLYTYIVRGIGPSAGMLGGWALLFGYMLTGMSTLCGFAVIANALVKQTVGMQLPAIAWYGVGALACFYIAFRDVQLSARTMLLCEGGSLLVVVLLGLLVLNKAGIVVDRDQVVLSGATPGGVLAGQVLVMFAFSGFESSTALGAEAQDPLETIPRSVLQSVAMAGAFFTFMAYVIVLGFHRSGGCLAGNDAPLNELAAYVGNPAIATVIDAGILVSFLSCTLASINSTARILFAMGRHGVVHDALGSAHVANRTPHVAVGLTTLLTFALPAVLDGAGISALDAQGYFGTLCSFGFILVYILVSIAAPVYLASVQKLTARSVACAAIATAFMLLPLVGSVGIPGSTLFPPAPGGVALVSIFLGYMLLGSGWFLIQRKRRPGMRLRMQSAGEALNETRSTVP